MYMFNKNVAYLCKNHTKDIIIFTPFAMMFITVEYTGSPLGERNSTKQSIVVRNGAEKIRALKYPSNAGLIDSSLQRKLLSK